MRALLEFGVTRRGTLGPVNISVANGTGLRVRRPVAPDLNPCRLGLLFVAIVVCLSGGCAEHSTSEAERRMALEVAGGARAEPTAATVTCAHGVVVSVSAPASEVG